METQIDEGEPFYTYSLRVIFLSENRDELNIPVADFSRMGGGVRLSKWKIKRRGKQVILSAYYFISAMGHDLDQWIHYDLETGKEIGRTI